MKRILFITILLILALSFSFAQDSYSLQTTPQVTTLNELIDSSENLIGYYLIGGAGIITGQTWSDWSGEFYLGPAFNFGIELPFSSSHIFSFELLGHCWVAKPKDSYDSDNYVHLSNSLYSQFYFTGMIKCHLSSNTERFRLSFHAGSMFLSTNKSQTGPIIGVALNYSLNIKCYFGLAWTLYLKGTSVGGGSGGVSGKVPNILMLNYCHKFDW